MYTRNDWGIPVSPRCR